MKHVRTGFVFGFFLLWGIALLYQLYSIQVTHHEKYTEKARSQHYSKTEITMFRGEIFDRTGRPLAVNTPGYSVFVQRVQAESVSEIIRVLKKFQLLRDEQAFLRKLDESPSFVWVARRTVPTDIAHEIERMKLPGLYVIQEEQRTYPYASYAGSVIGCVGTDLQGLTGLEFAFDKDLRGIRIRIPVLRDAFLRQLWLNGDQASQFLQDRSLYTTIDIRAQAHAEALLKKMVEHEKIRRGLIVGMDPDTGEIMFHAQYPSFEPDLCAQHTKSFDRAGVGALHWIFEPGSTLKPFLIALALSFYPNIEQKNFYGYNGRIQIGDVTIHDHKTFNWLTLWEVLEESSNVGMVQIANFLKPAELYFGLMAFGFGQKTGTPFYGESRGKFKSFTKWYPSDRVYLAIGQGIAFTPIQILRAYAAIANGGYLVRPTFVRKVGVRTFPPFKKKVPLPQDILVRVREGLIRVVEKGTGRRARIPGYAIAGKTGTAEKINTRKNGKVEHTSYFVGFFPAHNPKIVMLVVLDEPKYHYYGGEISAPLFREMAERLIRMWHIPPEYVIPESIPDDSRHLFQAQYHFSEETWPDLRTMTLEDALEWAHTKNLTLYTRGNGSRILDQLPIPGTPLSVKKGIVWLEPSTPFQAQSSEGPVKHDEKRIVQSFIHRGTVYR